MIYILQVYLIINKAKLEKIVIGEDSLMNNVVRVGIDVMILKDNKGGC